MELGRRRGKQHSEVCADMQHYTRPYMSTSPATTLSSLSAPPITLPDPSPSVDTDSSHQSYLPEGASQPTSQANSVTPSIPSPLGHGSLTDLPVIKSSPSSTSTAKPSKMLAKQAKAAEKAEAETVSRQRAEAARELAAKKQAQKGAEIRAKDEAKRKEKLEKEERKAAAKTAKIKSPSKLSLLGSSKPAGVAPAAPPSALPTAPIQLISTPHTPTPTKTVPVRAEISPSSSDPRSNPREATSDQVGKPPPIVLPIKSGPPMNASRAKLGMLGTIKKRLSFFGTEPKVMDLAVLNEPTPAASTSALTLSTTEPGDLTRNPQPVVSQQVTAASATTVASPQSATPLRDSPVPTSPPVAPQSSVPSASRIQIESVPPNAISAMSRHRSTSSPQQIHSSSMLDSGSQQPSSPSLSHSPSRNGASPIRGPRAMPGMRPRPASISVHPTDVPNPTGPPVVARSDVAAPSTSGGSSVYTRSMDLGSPFISDASRQSSMTSENLGSNRSGESQSTGSKEERQIDNIHRAIKQ